MKKRWIEEKGKAKKRPEEVEVCMYIAAVVVVVFCPERRCPYFDSLLWRSLVV